ncbi:MAG: CopG family transcriptional regulator [Bacteroidetes bacterium]|nr:CopG family transcriptional regulator [Bacteroidota bacterium]
MKPITFTSTLPSEVWDMLEKYALRLKIPKNRLMEKALRNYFDHLKKAEYTLSFRKAAGDETLKPMAEEGLEEYIKMIEDHETA